MSTPNSIKTAGRPCNFRGCDRFIGKWGCKGYCRGHYGQFKRLKWDELQLKPLRPLSIPEGFEYCTRCYSIKPVYQFDSRCCKPCSQEYMRLYKYGLEQAEFLIFMEKQMGFVVSAKRILLKRHILIITMKQEKSGGFYAFFVISV